MIVGGRNRPQIQVTDASTQPVILGRIVGLFGIKGWVKVYSYTEPREAVLDYDGWLLRRDERWEPAELAEGKRHGKSIIARLRVTSKIATRQHSS